MAAPLTSPSAQRVIAFSAAALVVTAAFRFLALTGFPNDHFVHLTPARQMLLGDWPVRDFQDPGLPLMYAVSAASQWLLGPTLFSEAVLVAVAFGAAAALTIVFVVRLTGSMALAVGAATVEVLIFPRSYSYPKVLLYALAFLLFDRFVVRPTTARLLAVAAAVAVAFLFRHDHGLYLWIGGVLAAVLATPGDRWNRIRRAAVFTGLVAAMLLPYFLYVQFAEGFWLYLRTGIEFSRREAAHSAHLWLPLWGPDAPYAVLIYLFYALPVLALAVALRKGPTTAARIVPVAVVALLVDASFLRDPLMTRVPDAVVPAAALATWLGAQAQRARTRTALLPLAFALLIAAAWAVFHVGHPLEELDRTGIRTVGDVAERFGQRTSQLRARFDPQQMPSRIVARLQPFFAYLDRCTPEQDRLLTAGFLPEVPYYARRGFAGGQDVFMYGYYGSPDNQRQAIDRLRAQSVPFVLVPSNYARDLEEDFPLVNAFVTARYVPLTTVDVDEELSISILIARMRPATSQDPETGWPCFR